MAIFAGMMRPWIIGDVILFFVGMPLKRPHPMIYVMSLPVLITIFWTDVWLETLMFPIRLILLQSAIRHTESSKTVIATTAIGLLIHSMIGAFAAFDHRPIVFFHNSQEFGAANYSLVTSFPIIAGIGVALSGARIPVFLMMVAFAFNRTRTYAFAAMITLLIFIATLVAQNSLERIGLSTSDVINLDTVNRSIELRDDNFTGSISEGVIKFTPELIREEPQRKWVWHGYGYFSFVHKTGIDKPHNTFMLAWFELGIFSIPFFIAFAYGMWNLLPLKWWPMVVIYLFLIDDHYALTYGVYASVLFLYPVMHRTGGAKRCPAPDPAPSAS